MAPATCNSRNQAVSARTHAIFDTEVSSPELQTTPQTPIMESRLTDRSPLHFLHAIPSIQKKPRCGNCGPATSPTTTLSSAQKKGRTCHWVGLGIWGFRSINQVCCFVLNRTSSPCRNTVALANCFGHEGCGFETVLVPPSPRTPKKP